MVKNSIQTLKIIGKQAKKKRFRLPLTSYFHQKSATLKGKTTDKI